MSGVVVVGGGLGGLRTAESLRASGYAGAITVVGDEPHLPYNRPPLSKEALRGGVDIDGLVFTEVLSVTSHHQQTNRARIISQMKTQFTFCKIWI